MALIDATNCHRAYAADGVSLGADFVSHIIDFRDMPMGSIQIVWQGAGGAMDGEFTIHASNLPEESSFDEDGCVIECSEMTLGKASGSRIWIRDRLAFRYALVRYKANGTVGGTVEVIALGKKS